MVLVVNASPLMCFWDLRYPAEGIFCQEACTELHPRSKWRYQHTCFYQPDDHVSIRDPLRICRYLRTLHQILTISILKARVYHHECSVLMVSEWVRSSICLSQTIRRSWVDFMGRYVERYTNISNTMAQ